MTDQPADPSAPKWFELHDEKFECVPRLSGSVILAHENAMSAEGPGRGLVALAALDNYLRKALLPAEYVRYRVFADDPDREIEIEDIANGVMKLHVAYLTRPTKRPSGSPDGPGSTGDTSTGGSPSEDSTSTKSSEETPDGS